MEIKNLPIYKINNYNNVQTPRYGVSCPNLAPLKQDTLSFKGAVLKKSDFEGIDLAVIERFKPNIQQLKSKDDLQIFAENKIKKLKEKDYGGRQEETIVQRKAMLKEWFDYVTKENNAYSNTQQLIILSSLTKDLKPNNDNIPEVLNKGVLAQTVTELEQRLKSNPKENLDFLKMYKNNLRISMIDDSSTGVTMTGWVVIPSKKHDPENFEKNVEKLKTLSHKNWCTKSFNAEPYLSEGDFHVYLENGQPKLGVRFVGDKVQEIQGEKNNSKIPVKYLNTFRNYQQEHNMQLSSDANKQLKNAQCAQIEYEKIISKLDESVKLRNVDDALKVLTLCGIDAEKNENDKITILNDYGEKDIAFSELNINEDKIFKYVDTIKGNFNVCQTELTDFGSLRNVFGDVKMVFSKFKNIGNLEYIGGSLDLESSKVTSLGKLKKVDGYVDLTDSCVKDLGDLECIGGYLELNNCDVTSLGKLASIGGHAYLHYSQIKDLGNLKYIGGDVCFEYSDLNYDNFDNVEIGGKIRKSFYEMD